MDYKDAKHRPHAVHTGEEPRNPITYGPESLRVTLDRWGPVDNLFTSMYDALQANWGESPSRTVNRSCSCGHLDHIHTNDPSELDTWKHRTQWCKLNNNERDYVESCFAGKTLQQVLEGVTFDFCIDGVSRAFTHQNVRTRLGAGFMQHGGRDNDWRHRPWTMPETMRRMCVEYNDIHKGIGGETDLHHSGLQHCISSWEPIDRYLNNEISDVGSDVDTCNVTSNGGGMQEAIEQHIARGRRLYSALVDAGIPWQDARRVLFMGMQTYIHDQYNYLALAGVLANRLEHIMDWEFNCVAQLMLREIKMKCPPLLSKYLGSHSDKARQAKFAGLESWPPDRKYPSPYDDCATCDHAAANHYKMEPVRGHVSPPDEMVCHQCENENDPHDMRIAPLHRFIPKDRLERQHRPEQMPFFVLHPDSMAGGPIVWIPTNGQYPHDQAPVK